MKTQRIRRTKDFDPYLPALRAARVLAVDLETTGLDPYASGIRLIQIAAEGLPVLLLDAPAFLPEPEAVPLLRELLCGPAVKVLQNAKFDLQFLMALGICPKPLFDTMLAAQLLYMPGTPRRANLETLAMHYLGETLDKSEQKGDWARETLTDAQLEYAARDAEILLRLR
ncbi:MAG TPA: bifunctional 3'-5' exonuclease/DNA polymerase, partial [Clostridia bacterium]|nr:bifunctional 3'-5' exonuclease/DNA polymerase [Clostridia bacterium]